MLGGRDDQASTSTTDPARPRRRGHPGAEAPAGGEKTDVLGVPAVSDQRGPAIRALAQSGRQRHHWRGNHRELPDVVFLFETVVDRGEHWAIRHLELHASGRVLRYWWDHLQDGDGFLADASRVGYGTAHRG